jgi:hypothetical protein
LRGLNSCAFSKEKYYHLADIRYRVLLPEERRSRGFQAGLILAPELLARKHRDVAETKSARDGPNEGDPEVETFGTFYRLYGYGGKPR